MTARERAALVLLIVLIVGMRVATLNAYPLMDDTESRYAEIARKMLETGRWLMPQIDYGVPFWGKPPLSTWFSAASMGALGVGEFGARLPSFLMFVACAIPLALMASLRGGGDLALRALALFASTVIVFIAAGAVMTDPALVLGTTLSMAGFWMAVCGPGRLRLAGSAGFFAGLAVGLMSKGPVALVLTFLPVGAWTVWTGRWRDVWECLPWAAGSVVTAALVIPWYWAAERATPGFLDYFIVGEHWKRFIEAGWKGDLYGVAHAHPRGMIWLYWIAAALPWSAAALAWLVRAAGWRRDDLRKLYADPWRAYLLLWTIAPMVFFSMSGNILATYVLPGMPSFALLMGDVWQPDADDRRVLRPAIRWLLVAGIAVPVGFVAVITTQRGRFETVQSQKALVRAWEAMRADSSQRLVYAGRPPASADFYSRGTAAKVRDVTMLAPFFNDQAMDFIVVRAGDLTRVPEATRFPLAPVGEFGDYRMLRETPR